MKFMCPLFIVSDIARAKAFYENILGQTVKFDFGENIVFEGDFSLQEKQRFSELTGLAASRLSPAAHNGELYFEEEDFDRFMEKLESLEDIRFVHHVKEHPWGQRVIRFFDPDGHIVEVGENMEEVARNMLRRGCSVQQTANKTQYPVEFVQNLLGSL